MNLGPLCLAAIATSYLLGGCSFDMEAQRPSGVIDRAANEQQWVDFREAQAGCLEERGYEVIFRDDGGMQIDHGGTLDQGQLLLLLDECAKEVGGEPAPAPLHEAEIGKFYDLQLEAYQCLVDAGFQPEQPSSREAYIAGWESGDYWDPYIVPNQGGLLPDEECPKPELSDITW